jgi:uncharacterized protein YndB with AHSA1/START domain
MNKIIMQTARLHCTVERAFALFTQSEHLASWLTRFAEIEPVLGGKYELFWDPDDPERNSTLGCKIVAIEPHTLLAFEWKGPPQFRFMNEVDPLTQVTVFFTSCNEVLTPCTDVYLLHSGWRVTEEWEEAREYFARAWETAFAEMETTING